MWAWGAVRDPLNPAPVPHTSPVQVSGLSGIVAVEGGGSFDLALKSDGTVWAWGNNDSGQLGRGGNTCPANSCAIPAQVPGLSGVTAIAAGTWHSLAVKSDGTLWGWGDNSYYQLGDGSTNDHFSPVLITTGMVGVTANFNHALAVKSDGTVWGWGATVMASSVTAPPRAARHRCRCPA